MADGFDNPAEVIMNIEKYLDTFFPQFEPALKLRLKTECSIKVFNPGDQLLYTGQNLRSTLLVVGGVAKLYREGEQGEVFMYYLEPGTACALSMICLSKQKTSEVTAKAIEQTTALVLPIQFMDEFMLKYITWYDFVLETYRSRFAELLTFIDSIAFKGMDGRLENYLKGQHAKWGNKDLYITHQEIANDLNTSREVISRLLKKMEENNYVRLHRNFIELIKIAHH